MNIPLINAIQNSINQPYKLGEIDCFRIIYDYLQKQLSLPKEFKNYTLNNYKDLYSKNPDEARKIMIEFLEFYLLEKDPCQMIVGDILVLNYCFGPIFLGINVGNGKILITTLDGTCIMFMKHYNIKRVFGWQR